MVYRQIRYGLGGSELGQHLHLLGRPLQIGKCFAVFAYHFHLLGELLLEKPVQGGDFPNPLLQLSGLVLDKVVQVSGKPFHGDGVSDHTAHLIQVERLLQEVGDASLVSLLHGITIAMARQDYHRIRIGRF